MRPDMPATSPLDPRTRTPRPPTASPVPGRTPTDPATGRTPTNPATGRTPTGDPARSRPKTGGPAISRTSTARKTAALVAARTILLEQGADHFALLGVPFDAPIDTVRTTYLNLVRQLHPDKLAELDVGDPAGNATRLFAAMGNAFSVLTDPVRREPYVAAIVAGGVGAPRTKTGDDVSTSPAAEAFRRGEAALRRDEPHEAIVHFQKAIEISPQDVDYHAMLAWAQFCAASDKVKIANETRRVLDRAIQRSTKPLGARLLLGRVERMLGRDREALRQFQIVLEEQPSHADARSEIRVIEARLAGNVGKKR
jgi:tetratricopeptide (TPR) repeat protein